MTVITRRGNRGSTYLREQFTHGFFGAAESATLPRGDGLAVNDWVMIFRRQYGGLSQVRKSGWMGPTDGGERWIRMQYRMQESLD